MKLTTEELREMRERCEKATAGPWESVEDEYVGNNGWVKELKISGVTGEVYEDVDAAFIAASRTDMPRLLDAYEASEKENEQLREALEKATSWAAELVDAHEQCDCTNPDGGNPMTCEYCAGMRTIDSLHEALEGGEPK